MLFIYCTYICYKTSLVTGRNMHTFAAFLYIYIFILYDHYTCSRARKTHSFNTTYLAGLCHLYIIYILIKLSKVSIHRKTILQYIVIAVLTFVRLQYLPETPSQSGNRTHPTSDTIYSVLSGSFVLGALQS